MEVLFHLPSHPQTWNLAGGFWFGPLFLKRDPWIPRGLEGFPFQPEQIQGRVTRSTRFHVPRGFSSFSGEAHSSSMALRRMSLASCPLGCEASSTGHKLVAWKPLSCSMETLRNPPYQIHLLIPLQREVQIQLDADCLEVVVQ